MDLRRFIKQQGFTPASFASAVGVLPQIVNHWFVRGIPANRMFDVSDAIGVPVSELRPYCSEGRKPQPPTAGEIRRFKALFARLDPEKQDEILRDLAANRSE